MILFNIGLALKNFGEFQQPVSLALRQAAEEYVETLGSNETEEDQALQMFLYQLFTQEHCQGHSTHNTPSELKTR